jgi:demethoxyubiquinone hydroxylase (CLK1/Coq7/Cat5 family)
MQTRKTNARNRTVTEGHAREIADEIVREAMQEQARELEAHLNSIHERLVKLETRP